MGGFGTFFTSWRKLRNYVDTCHLTTEPIDYRSCLKSRTLELRIPPTAVGGSFKSCLQKRPLTTVLRQERCYSKQEWEPPTVACMSNAPVLFSRHVPHTLHKPGLGLSTSLLPLFSHASSACIFRHNLKRQYSHCNCERDLPEAQLSFAAVQAPSRSAPLSPKPATGAVDLASDADNQNQRCT